MKILVILAHPNRGSFNHAIANQVLITLGISGCDVIFHDLYHEKFDPLLPYREIQKDGKIHDEIEQHCSELVESDGMIFIHPNWWGQPPAILKGWIDRVIRQDVAYRFNEGDSGEGIPEGLLKGKSALVFNTSDTADHREKSLFGDPLESIWKQCIFNFCGIEKYYRKTFSIVVTSSAGQRKNWLNEVGDIIKVHFQL